MKLQKLRLKSLEYIKRDGLKSFFLWVLRQWFLPVMRVRIEYQLLLDLKSVDLERIKRRLKISLDIVLLDITNLYKYREIATFQNIDLKVFENRIVQGDKGFIAIYDNKPIGYVWVGFKNCIVPGLNSEFYLKPEEAYLYNEFVLDQFRGKGVGPALVIEVISRLSTMKKSRLLTWVLTDNIASLKSLCKFGYKKDKIFTLVELFKKRIALISFKPSVRSIF